MIYLNTKTKYYKKKEPDIQLGANIAPSVVMPGSS